MTCNCCVSLSCTGGGSLKKVVDKEYRKALWYLLRECKRRGIMVKVVDKGAGNFDVVDK